MGDWGFTNRIRLRLLPVLWMGQEGLMTLSTWEELASSASFPRPRGTPGESRQTVKGYVSFR
jgi:hypothetical protein